MNFEKFIANFEEKISLERIYDVQKISEGQTIPLPPSKTSKDLTITIGKNTKGYLLIRPGNIKFEIFISKKTFGCPEIWAFKRTGEYIGESKFNNIEDALHWMIETVIQ
ncbi:hypothetical protein ACG0OA_08525, partial [Campylobacter jejuni]|uniref:hypothetical protein n=1 Tax=Campylobacter jejuni TaxID=197 RepID=UPI0037451E9C